MQDQIESFNQMLKQLASQREMAVKKLADMDHQIEELNRIIETERIQVEAKDRELKTKRTQLQTLKDLKDKLRENDSVEENLSKSQMAEIQVKTKLAELQVFLTKTNTAMDDIENAINIKDTIKLSALTSQMLTPPSPLSVTEPATCQPLDDSFDPFANEDPFDGDPFEAEPVNLALPEDDPFNPSAAVSGGFDLGQNDPFAPQQSQFCEPIDN